MVIMRTTSALLITALVSLSGCAARQTSRQAAYACPSGTVVPADGSGSALVVGGRMAALSTTDGAGDHYTMVHGDSVRDYVLPRDEREDALVWETGNGGHKLIERCTASGGHTDVLTRWLEGESLAEIGHSIGADEAEAKRRLRRAIIWMNRTSRQNDALPARSVPTLARR